jgi:hypothetical protein
MASVATQTFKYFIVRNLTLKLLCLATAISVWSLSSISRKTCVELPIPLKLGNIPAGFVPSRPPPAAIGYTLSGPAALIDGARRANKTVMLSMEGASRPGKTIFMNLESQLKLPDGIRVVRVSPATLEIDLKAEHSPQGDQRK